MSTHRISAVTTSALVAVILVAAPAEARKAPDPGDAGHTVPAQHPLSSSSPCSVPADSRPAAPAHSRAVETRSNDPGDGYSDYPAGAAGTSIGELTAAQRGEPVGAGGNSGGSSSPFARASAPSLAGALARVSAPVDQCRPAMSLAERRLIHADLIEALRDDQ